LKRIEVLPSFERSLKKLSPQDKEKVKKALKMFNKFLTSAILPRGLGLKKINQDKYEIRMDIRLRIILKLEGEVFYLVLVGNHQAIKNYLKKYR
jgi:mRNA-degrading endonuclease RelE of RelBE toxin-antitoxin system